MNRQNQREDEPENIPPNAPPTTENQINVGNKEIVASNISQAGSLQSVEARSIFETTVFESDRIIKKIDQFNAISCKVEQDYYDLQELFDNHIRANIHPTSCTNTGDFLLRNGKFVVAFIDVMTRREKKDYLKRYLYNYFDQANKISHDKEVFDANKQIWINRPQESEKTHKQTQKQGRNRLLNSPNSSRNQANWSTKVEKDTNSPYKSSVFDSEYQKKSLQNLKRINIRPPIQVNEQQEKSQKVKNSKKSSKKTNTKTKQRNTPYKSKSKGKSQQKRALSKSHQRELKKLQETAFRSKEQNEKQQQQKLGSCYHYEILLNPKNKHKQLTQIRASARLSNVNQRASITKQSLRKNTASKTKSKQKNIKSKSKSHNKAKNQDKKTKKRNEQETQQQNNTDDSSYHLEEGSQNANIEWVKEHLKQLDIRDVKMYSDFKALTSNDVKITKLLQQMQNSQQATITVPIQLAKKTKQKRNSSKSKKQAQKNEKSAQKIQQKEQINRNQQEDYEPAPIEMIESEKPKKTFQEIKKECQIQQLPTTIDYVIDPDLNNHGIYAMLRLGRVTEFDLGTAYALTPITFGLQANKKHLLQDLKKAQLIAGSDNIAYIPLSLQILDMIKAKRKSQNRLD